MKGTGNLKGTIQTVVFKDPYPLAQDFIPKRIQFRDKQIQNISYYLSGFIRYGILMSNIIVYGHPETGKTHSVKRVLSEINQAFQTACDKPEGFVKATIVM